MAVNTPVTETENVAPATVVGGVIVHDANAMALVAWKVCPDDEMESCSILNDQLTTVIVMLPGFIVMLPQTVSAVDDGVKVIAGVAQY